MAEAVVAPIVEDIWKRLVAATSQQFGYLIHYNRNIRNLNEQVEKLESLINDNQRFIQAAKDNNKEIRDEVENWMKRADGIMLEAKKNVEDANANKMCFFGWCPDLISCYRLSRKANKKVNTVTQLEEEGNFPDVSKPAPTPGIGTFLSTGDFVNFETTRSAMEKVMEALKEDKINVVGIHGMGGAGKTTMAKEIAQEAEEEKLFDKVVFAVVSQTVDLKKIQDQLADQLGLQFNEKSELGRAGQLQVRLKSEKRILVILDDVWARLDVTAIRIPMGVDHEGCKLIITTRREQVCRTMGMGRETTKIIHLGVLSEQESWDLFRRKAGDVIGSPTLMAVAQEVAAECGGLPIALVTVGRAMRDVKDEKEWKEAANMLKKSMPTEIEGVDQEVYKCLKFSYDYLRNEEAKACFLLCSLFPEDHNIPLEDLVRYGMGLGIFENVDTVNEARRRTRLIINNLVSSCLLMLAGNMEGNVKMHDVVRDVAITIGSKKYLVRAGKNLKEWPNLEKDYTGISLMHNLITEHPDALECPKLQILLLQNDYTHQIPGDFKGMEALKVFDGSIRADCYALYRKFEPSFSYLTNIRTLILEGWRFGDITALGEIKTLEILSFARCVFREPLNALRHLTNLRLLDLSFCQIDFWKISSIVPQDVISRLSRLEELYMEGASASWASAGSYENLTMHIVELSSLPHLTTLTMHIDGLECIPENFVFPELEIFRITIGPDDENPRRNNYFFHEAVNRFENYFVGHSLNILKTLEVRGCDELEYLSQRLGFNDLEKLSLLGLKNFLGIYHGVLPHDLYLMKLKILKVGSCPKLSNIFPRSGSPQRLKELEMLKVKDCEAMEHIFDLEFEGPIAEEKELLASLRELELVSLFKLKHIWKGPTENIILHNLQKVKIRYCVELKNLFLPAIARTLEKLEDLVVSDCTKLEEIVAKEQEGQEEEEAAANRIVFPQLKTLNLRSLNNLDGFCRGCFSFEWPSLERVHLESCPKLITFTAAVAIDGTQSTLNQKGSEVEFYPKSSISFAPLELLQNLQELRISSCHALENIFDLEFEGPIAEEKELLASLRELELERLYELKHIWKGPTENIILHNLQKVKIRCCFELKNLFLPAIARTLKKLEALDVFECTKLEEIIAKEQEGQEEEEAAANRIVFPQLKTLDLRILNNLDGFCRGCFSFEWPSLERVHLGSCPKLITFTAAVAIDGTQSTLNQKGSEVEFYPKSSISFAPLELLQNLQELRISSCHALENIFDLEFEGPIAEEKELLASLRELELERLYKLKHIWTGPTSQVILHNLKKVDISFCTKLKSLFLPTIARTLEKLEDLTVYHCNELEEIVAKEQEGHEEGEAAIHKIVFPQLKTLHLYWLSNLNGFCIGSFPFEWPSLELVEVKRCRKMKTFTAAVPADGIQSTPKLNTIKLDDVVIDVVDINSAIQKHFNEKNLRTNFKLFIEDCEALEAKELLANLKELQLEDQHELKYLWKGPTAQVILHNLQQVTIIRCKKLKSLFLPTIARTLEKLEYLEVTRCDELEEIVAKEQEGHEEGEAAIHKIVFPQLKKLRLVALSNLNGFCTGSFPFEWPSLELVVVYGCPKMKTFTAAVPADGIQSTPKLNTIKLDDVVIDVVDINSAIQKHFKEKELYIKELLENKDFQANLKVLRLNYYHELKHLWKGPTAQVILHNLQKVEIDGCNKLKNLFLPTIARTLEKLEYLEVHDCDELEEIVAKEQEGHEEGEAAIHKIVFPQLKTLHLYKLSNLNGFCIGSFPFEWPSLQLVRVNMCPKMKTFTAAVPADGIQSTPKLNTIELDYVKIDVLDINSAIQKHFKGKYAYRMEPSDESNDPQSSTQ